jgi:hypothetical protein
MHFDAVLGPDQVVAERPFTDVCNTQRDLEIMRTMLALERARAEEWASSSLPGGRQRVIRGADDQGRRQLLAIPDVERLLSAGDTTAVGFFATPRAVDHTVLFELEDELVERMPVYAELGLLSYFDLEMGEGRYGNLILFATPDVPEAWHADPLHRRAVEHSPHHYWSVRLHKGSVAGPFQGGEIRLERTKYFDFATDKPWQGIREFDPAVQ